MKVVAAQLPGAYLVVSVLKESLSKNEKALLISLARWGRRKRLNGKPQNPLIVLTGTELLTEWHVGFTWKELGGKAKSLTEPAAVNISYPLTFAELTQRIYLDLPPFHEDFRPKKATVTTSVRGKRSE